MRMASQSSICMFLHRNWAKLPGVSLSIPNTFPFKCFSNAVVYNFYQSVNSLAGISQRLLKWQSLVHQTDCIPPSCSILLFFFYRLPSIPKPAVIPSVRGWSLTVPDLWNDDRGAWAPYPSVFISHFCPPPLPLPPPPPPPPPHMLHWALVVVTLTVTDVPGPTGLETPPKSSQPWPQPAGRVPEQGLYRLEVREWWKELLLRVRQVSTVRGRQRKDCWSKKKLTKPSLGALNILCFLCVPLAEFKLLE